VPGLEGVVAKHCDRPYLAGERQWIKVKKQRTADCAVIGIAGDRSRPSLVLGLRHADGLFHHLGRLGVSSVIFGACRPPQHPSTNAL
jgi:ATP-dependent DNA ligase